jgi:hypothetical protein
MHFALRNRHYGPIWSVFFPEPDIQAIEKEFEQPHRDEPSENIESEMEPIDIEFQDEIDEPSEIASNRYTALHITLLAVVCLPVPLFFTSDIASKRYTFKGFESALETEIRDALLNPQMEEVYTFNIAGRTRYFNY